MFIFLVTASSYLTFGKHISPIIKFFFFVRSLFQIVKGIKCFSGGRPYMITRFIPFFSFHHHSKTVHSTGPQSSVPADLLRHWSGTGLASRRAPRRLLGRFSMQHLAVSGHAPNACELIPNLFGRQFLLQ